MLNGRARGLVARTGCSVALLLGCLSLTASAQERQVPLMIETDMPAIVSVNGEVIATLPANGATRVTLPLGEHVVKAVSTEDQNIVWRQVVTAEDTRQKAVMVSLKPLADAEEKRRAEERAEREREETEAFVRQMVGGWTEVKELSGRYSNTNNPYKMVRTTTLTLAPASDGSLVGTLYLEKAFSDARGGQKQETIAELNFLLEGAQVSQVILTFAQQRVGPDWVDLPTARISDVVVDGAETIRLTVFQREGDTDELELHKVS